MTSSSRHPTLSVIVPLSGPDGRDRLVPFLENMASGTLPVSMEIILVTDPDGNTAEPDCLKRNRPAFSVKQLTTENGSALLTGIRNSSGSVIFIPDGPECSPDDLVKCISPVLHGECKAVYGARKDSKPGLKEQFGIWRRNLLFNTELTCSLSCCKAFDGELLRLLASDMNSINPEMEITADLLRLGFEIRETALPGTAGRHRRTGIFRNALVRRFAPIGKLRRQTGELSASCAETIRKHRSNTLAMVIVFMIAFLLRLLVTIPGLSSPQLLMRPDSAPFLASAGPGIFTAMPAFHKPYPAGWRKWKTDTPQFRKVYGSETPAPLYPLWLSVIFGIGRHSLPFAAVAGCLLGALACVPVMLAGRLFGSPRIGVIAGLLLALNPTAVVFSPLFLPDTLFLLLVSVQVWFFLRFVKNGLLPNLAAAMISGALAALVSPVNAGWIIAAMAVMLFLRLPLSVRLKSILTALLLSGIILFPWLYASHRAGIGWRIGTSHSELLLKDTAAVEAAAGRRKSDLAANYRNELYERYAAEPERFAALGAQLDERERFLLEKLARHPFRALALHFNPAVLHQDLGGMFINLGIFTVPPQFYLKLLYTFSVLLSMVIILGLGWYFIAAADRRSWIPVLLFLLLAGYYLLAPGSTGSPRSQLPALPFICLAAAFGLVYFHGIVKEKKVPSGL